MNAVRRGILVLTAVLLGWQVITTGLTAHYAEKISPTDPASIERVLSWDPDQPGALLQQARSSLESAPETAQPLLERAYRANPTDPRALLVIADGLSKAGNTEQADALIVIADRLDPAAPFIQRPIAAYWANRQQLDRAIRHVSNVLIADAHANTDLFPVLLSIADRPEQRDLLKPLTIAPPVWWPAFFNYICENARSNDTVRFLFNLRRQSRQAPLNAQERKVYCERLIRDGRISEAYLIWVNGLDEQGRDALGPLFNGGFELPLQNTGFGWHAGNNRRAEISTLMTREASGQHALRIRFRSFDRHFEQLWQPLFLDAGTYRFAGRVRSDNLRTQGGLRWQIRCLLPEQRALAESPRFLGSNEWLQITFDFVIPNECRYQEIRLISAGQHDFERDISGIVWFDDLQIHRTASLASAAKADLMIRQPGSRDVTPSQRVPLDQDSGENTRAPDPSEKMSEFTNE